MRLYIIGILILFSTITFSQDGIVYMHPNRGQWDSKILYQVDLQNGYFYFDQEGYTVALRNFNHHSDYDGKEKDMNYAMKMKYLNANFNTNFTEEQPTKSYRNYFLGSDKTKWKSKVYSFQKVIRKGLYQGIDVETKGNNDGTFEILYHVSSQADINQLKIQYEGFDKITIQKDGSLKMTHPIGFISESKPIAWNVTESGNKIPVEVNYKLERNIVSFEFPNGYNTNQQLIIDPVLAFSTFTGATSDNWGFTAAPDPQGNAFGGGIVFASKFPTTAGAFDDTFGGGTVDAVITKFSSDGSQLLYSTFLGGNSSETPHSIVSNKQGEIYVMGITGSSNFPLTSNAYQQTFKGGNYSTANGITFASGTDIFICKFNASGTNLLSSTLIGGAKNDGLSVNDLVYNYGDQFRGDITLDANENVYVASTTYSNNFPLMQSTTPFGGIQDGVAFKMNSSLSQLLWSTYIGGDSFDAAYSVQVANDGSIYIAGGSKSTDLTFPNGIKTSTNGGIDGFIVKYSSSFQLQKGTFVGTPQYDQVYFLQLDLDQNIYVYGQTLGNMPISSGKYGNANSGQFIKKYDNTFSTELWSTLIGTGVKKIDISPTAFLVSDCYDIYFAGWGGTVNSDHSQATSSSTNGLPVTSDAFQSNTNGSNFYIGVLKPNATGLKYATFIGGVNSSANHVDGGTSRFDKSGKMYHAVCAACGGNTNGFTTTPGVYAPKNNSSNCNMAVFKFELSFIETSITNINPVICYPGTITFDNVTTTGDTYFWDFGDGNSSNQLNPTHTYNSPGNYTVSFVVHDTQNCFSSDTVKFPVEVRQFTANVVAPADTICPNKPYQLNASGGTNYSWSPANYLDNPNIANPTATISGTTDFTVKVTDNECGEISLNVQLNVFEDSLIISQDTTICKGASVQLSANGAVTYTWSPQTNLDDPNSSHPIATPSSNISYTVDGISENNCPLKASTNITVITDPVPVMPDSITVCLGESATITAGGASTYSWSPNVEINTTSSHSVIIHPTNDRYYYCDFSNGCNVIRDSVWVKVIHAEVKAWNDTAICYGESVILHASGAKTYTWTPSVVKQNSSGSEVKATPDYTTAYIVVGTDSYGCKASDKVIVSVFPRPYVITYPDIYAVYDDEVQLGVQTNATGNYTWSPPDFLDCSDCMYPTATPNKPMIYTVTYTDLNGCIATDSIFIHYDPLLWIPNAFTPDADQFNGKFRFYGVNISDVTMDIYDRWGELIYTIRGFDDFWDGTYKGLQCPIGTYVWKIEYTDIFRDIILGQTGHVNLIR